MRINIFRWFNLGHFNFCRNNHTSFIVAKSYNYFSHRINGIFLKNIILFWIHWEPVLIESTKSVQALGALLDWILLFNCVCYYSAIQRYLSKYI